jgi:hypothetical protein
MRDEIERARCGGQERSFGVKKRRLPV